MHDINYRQDSLCTFCNIEEETILHLFWQCDIVNQFIENFSRWLFLKTNYFINFNVKMIIFGTNTRYHYKPLNNIIIILKYFIYKCKMQNVSLNLDNLILELKSQIKIERSVALSKNVFEKFEKDWALCLMLIEN